MAPFRFTLLCLVLLAGCNRTSSPAGPAPRGSLADARRGFQTRLVRHLSDKEAVAVPPPALLRVVHYESPAGQLAAYLSPAPKDGRKHPAIIWIFGGFGNSIGDTAWNEGPARNDQSASAFRKAGIVMMYPSLRGGNGNPGMQEGFFGEVDDVLAAADFLARQDFVDPTRIYLGGHSTGGTLVLLTAACSDRFRAVFSFGPAHNVAGYGAENLPFDLSDERELELRAPGQWLHSIKSPVFVFEGTDEPGNSISVQAMQRASTNPLARFHLVPGKDHFSILAPMTRLVAARILADSGPTTAITFTAQELSNLPAR